MSANSKKIQFVWLSLKDWNLWYVHMGVYYKLGSYTFPYICEPFGWEEQSTYIEKDTDEFLLNVQHYIIFQHEAGILAFLYFVSPSTKNTNSSHVQLNIRKNSFLYLLLHVVYYKMSE